MPGTTPSLAPRRPVFPRWFGWILLVLGLAGVGVLLFLRPGPTTVRWTVEDLTADAVLQVYAKAAKGYHESRSDAEYVPGAPAARQVDFSVPGGHRLREIRLDFSQRPAEYRLVSVELGRGKGAGFRSWVRYGPAELAERWVLNDQVERVESGPGGLLLRTAGPDGYAQLPLDPQEWRSALPPAEVWTWRLLRAAGWAGLLLAAALALALVRSGWVERAGSPATPRWNRAVPFLYLGGLGLLAAAVYGPYLTFEKFYLFKDVANDTVDAFWPFFHALATHFREHGWPLWGFRWGVGASLAGSIGDPFALPLFLLPPDAVAFGFGWMQWAKVVAAGGFFYGWLRLAGGGRYAAAVGATLLAFCAVMVIRGNWIHYATEVVMVAFALFAFECWWKRRIWQLLPLAILFMVVRGVFLAYLWSTLFLLYALVRIWMDGGLTVRRSPALLTKLGVLYLLGLALAGALLLPSLHGLLTSPRVAGPEAQVGTLWGEPWGALNPPDILWSGLASLFAPDLIGRGNFYSGWSNYLEGFHTYAGLLVLLLLPQALREPDRRRRGLLVLALLAVAAYFLLPTVRYALNAFSGTYFKTSSFWITLVLAGGAALGLDGLVRRRHLQPWMLGLTVLAALLLLRYLVHGEEPARWIRTDETLPVYRQAFFLLLVYGALLLGLGFRPSRPWALLLLPVFLALEVLWFAGASSQDRWNIRSDVVERGGLYYDGAREAAEWLAVHDPTFHRVEKDTPSVHFNDALHQGYRGVQSYHSFNTGSYLRFLGEEGFAVDYRHRYHGSSYITGLDNRRLLESLLSVKYYLRPRGGGNPDAFFYEPVGTFGRAELYENRFALPLGVSYADAIPEAVVRGLPPSARDLLALRAAILPEEGIRAQGLPRLPAEEVAAAVALAGAGPADPGWREWVRAAVADRRASAVRWEETGPDRFVGTVSGRGGLLFLSIPAAEGWRFRLDGREVQPVLTHFGWWGVPVPPGPHELVATFHAPFARAGLVTSAVGLLLWLGLSALRVGRSGRRAWLVPAATGNRS